MTSIEWTRGDDGTPGKTWNPVLGCTRCSPGCNNCYAIRVAAREMQPAHVGLTARTHPSDKGFGHFDLDWTGEVRLLPERLDEPLRWRKPRRVFVGSMTDLFHPDVPDEFLGHVWSSMAKCGVYALGRRPGPHTFQVLTKRPQRMASFVPRLLVNECDGAVDLYDRAETARLLGARPLPNVWLGTSVENQRYADLRIPHLLATPAAVRFLSIEPLLGPVDLDRWLWDEDQPRRLDLIDWVIVGGESGPGARPMEREWAESIVDQCRAAGVPVFVKQLGTVLARELGCVDRKGGKPDEWPEGLRVREWPERRA